MRILFVCTGNICRSPMGELLFPRFFSAPAITADSAGTRGLPSHPIDPSSAALLSRDSIDSSDFHSKRLTPQIANDADLILCFEPHHIYEVTAIAPRTGLRTFLLTSFADICDYCAQQRLLQSGITTVDKLTIAINQASLLRPMLPQPASIPDPYQHDFQMFIATYDTICRSLARIAQATMA